MALAGVAFLLAVARPSPAQPSACSEPETAAAAKQVAAARNALLELPTGDGAETDVSPRAQVAIAGMKDRLAAFVDAYMRCAPLEPDAAKVQAGLSALSHAYRMRKGFNYSELPKRSGTYGFELWFEAKPFPENRLLAVTAAFDIECGSDTMLLVYASKDGSWKQVLRWESKPYKDVGGAFWAFNYGISPPDGSGKWYAVATHINPWCTSNWRMIYYCVLRPGAVSQQPAALYSGSDSIWIGNDDEGKLAVGKDGFDLRFHAESIDPGVHNRLWIRHFTVTGNMVRRVRPVAASARDFVDEWIVSPWGEASAWTIARSASLLKEYHGRLPRLHHTAAGLFSFESIRACSDARDHRQVELSYENSERRDFFFQVTGAPDYVMSSVGEKPDPRCKGRNELEQDSQ